MVVWYGHERGKRTQWKAKDLKRPEQDIHMAKRNEWLEKAVSLFVQDAVSRGNRYKNKNLCEHHQRMEGARYQ